MTVVTSPLSLARLLWWHGEDALYERALEMSPETVADVGERAGALALDTKEADRLWPGRPRGDGILLLAVIEALEGDARPAVRQRRRPAKGMPDRLVASERDRWFDPGLKAVSDVVDQRNRERGARRGNST